MNKIINYIYNIITNADSTEVISFLGTIVGAIVSLIVMMITISFTSKNTKKQLEASRETSLEANRYSEYLNDIKYCIVRLNKAYFLSSNVCKMARNLSFFFNPFCTRIYKLKDFQSVAKYMNFINKYYGEILSFTYNVFTYMQLMNFNSQDKRSINIIVKRVRYNCNVCRILIRYRIIIDFLNICLKIPLNEKIKFKQHDPHLQDVSDGFQSMCESFQSLTIVIYDWNRKLISINKRRFDVRK